MTIRSLEKKGFQLWTPDRSINSHAVKGSAYRLGLWAMAGSKHGYIYPDWTAKGDALPHPDSRADSAWVSVPADGDVSWLSERLNFKRAHTQAIILGSHQTQLDEAARHFDDPQPAVAFRQDGEPMIGVLPVEFGKKMDFGTVALRLGKLSFEATMGYYSYKHQSLVTPAYVVERGFVTTKELGQMQPRTPMA